MKIEYVTSNRGKFEQAQHILDGWELEWVNLELTEIQGDPEVIVCAKAQEALRILNRPLIVEDVAIHCRALNGLPGPYIKEFLIKLKPAGLAELIHKYSDHSVETVCLTAFIKPGSQPLCFKGTTEGTIVSPRGETLIGDYSWSGIVLPRGGTKTYAELSPSELSKVSARRIALLRLREHLEHYEKELHQER